MRILVSNDDGIDSQGIGALTEAVKEFGEVYVVAPDREQSGAGHSLTLSRPLRIMKRGENRYAVDGTPTDCVNLAIKALLKDEEPILVVSGINHGSNVSDDITYSGTVAAALEGTILGIPSIAFSLACKKDEVANFKPAIYFAKKVVAKVLKDGLPPDVLLNVNIPNIKGDKLDEYEFTRMGKRSYDEPIPERLDPRGKKYYWIGGNEASYEHIPGVDFAALEKKIISITPIRLDLTHENYLEKFRSEWRL